MSKFRRIKPDDIKIDPRYQRDLDDRRALRMAEALDPDRVGVPLLSERSNGDLYAVDGQHRVVAHQIAGVGHKVILCEVMQGLTRTDEARLFIERNTGSTRVRPLDLFRARVEAKEPEALEILDIVEHAGLRVARSQTTTSVGSVGALQFAFRRGVLHLTLELLVRWCGGNDRTVFEGAIIKIVSRFFAEYPHADPVWLAKRLSKVAPGRLRDAVKRLCGAGNDITPHEAACQILRGHYNKGKRSGKLGKPSDER